MSGPRVLIFYQRKWGIRFGRFLCERILESLPEATFSALVFRPNALEDLRKGGSVTFEKHWYWEDLFENPRRYLDGEEPSLTEICRELGVDSVWPLVQSFRTMVKDYARKYYFAYTQSIPDEEILVYVRMTFKLVREMFDTVRPEMVIMPNAVALPHLMALEMARTRGIFIRCIADTKVSGYYMWVADRDIGAGSVFDAMGDPATAAVETLPHFEQARAYLETFRSRFIQPEYSGQDVSGPSLFGTLANPLFYLKMLELAFRRRFRRKHRSRSSVISIDNIPPHLVIRDQFSHYRYTRVANRMRYDPVPERFIYFPLQFQPEQMIDVIAPFFNNQLEAARLTAMALPDDLALVVKDHPAMVGRRSAEYLYKLQHQPNIRLVDYRVPTPELLQKSLGVVAISGTTLVEAAFLNKPAIQFGNVGTGLLFPHVVQCTDFTNLSRLIRRHILAFDAGDPAHDRAVLRFIALVMAHGFPLNYAGIWEQGQEGDREPMWLALKRDWLSWRREQTAAS